MIVNLFHPVKLSRSRSILKKIAKPKFFALQSNCLLVQLYLIEPYLFDGVRAVTRFPDFQRGRRSPASPGADRLGF